MLRDLRGRVLRESDPGYVPGPLMEVIRLLPGENAASRIDLQSRFERPLGRGWSARAAFRYGNCQPHPRCDPRYEDGDCTDYSSVRTWSQWQPI